MGSVAVRTPRRARGRRRAAQATRLASGFALGLASVLALGPFSGSALGSPPATSSASPRDPNELPPLPDPEGQPAHDAHRRDIDHASPASRRSRVVITAAPAYASFRMPFLGRPQIPMRGGGVLVAAQVALWRPLGLRVTAAHTMHPVDEAYVRDDDDEIVQTAGAGLVQATHAGLSATYALDLGRVVTTLDAGAGGLWIRSPPAVQDGQLGGPCLPQGVCDTGLACSAENVCRVGFTPQLHGGFSVDVQLGDRFAVGGELRYFALLTAPMVYPVYILAALRASIRF